MTTSWIETCPRCGNSELDDAAPKGVTLVNPAAHCPNCDWVQPMHILPPAGVALETLSAVCASSDSGFLDGQHFHRGYGRRCFGDWSEWYTDRMYYQVVCSCSCHKGKPRGEAAIIAALAATDDDAIADLTERYMPVFGDALKEIIARERGDDG